MKLRIIAVQVGNKIKKTPNKSKLFGRIFSFGKLHLAEYSAFGKLHLAEYSASAKITIQCTPSDYLINAIT